MKKLTTVAFLLACNHAHTLQQDFQVGIEGSRNYNQYETQGEELNKGNYSTGGGALKYVLSEDRFFFAIDNRFGVSGKHDDIKRTSSFENVVMNGFSLYQGETVISPYLGIGRHSFNIASHEDGATSKWERHAFFVPVGVSVRFKSGEATITPSIEYGRIVKGAHRFHVEKNPANEEFKTKEKTKGYLVRSGIEFKMGDFSVTPFFRLYHDKSKETVVSVPVTGVVQTLQIGSKFKLKELGVRVGYHF